MRLYIRILYGIFMSLQLFSYDCIRFKTSYTKTRVVLLAGESGDINAPYLIYKINCWIKSNKTIIEFLNRSRLINFIPEIVSKVYYGIVNSIIFKKLAGRFVR